MKLCEDRRGIYKKTEYIGATRVILDYEMPLAEVIYDFYDQLEKRDPRLRHDGLRPDRLPPRRIW